MYIESLRSSVRVPAEVDKKSISSSRVQLLKDNRSSLTSYSGLPRADAKIIKSKSIPKIRRTTSGTEQLFPSQACCRKLGTSILHKEVINEDINVRILLMSPSPNDAPPYSKSIIDLFSRFGSVNTEIIRLSGAENYYFQLFVTSCEQNVNILLPARFRGTIGVDGCSRVRYSADLQRGIERGEIRINATDMLEDEDEVHIHATRGANIRLMDEKSTNPQAAVWYGYEYGLDRDLTQK